MLTALVLMTIWFNSPYHEPSTTDVKIWLPPDATYTNYVSRFRFPPFRMRPITNAEMLALGTEQGFNPWSYPKPRQRVLTDGPHAGEVYWLDPGDNL